MPERSLPALDRVEAFCRTYGLRLPILMAPMAGACPPSLSIAVSRAGGMGACGAVLMQPDAIVAWASEARAGCDGGFQMNLWVPGPPPARDPAGEDSVRVFLAGWGPVVAPGDADAGPPDFAKQCEAVLESRPAVISSIMGLFPPSRRDRHRVAALSRGEGRTRVGRRARSQPTRRHAPDACVQRSTGTQPRDGLRPRRRITQSAFAGPLPGAARPDASHARGCRGERGRRPHAGVVGPVGRAGTSAPGGGARERDLVRRARAAQTRASLMAFSGHASIHLPHDSHADASGV
jgi:hypothetical protein